MRPSTDTEWNKLPHVIWTSDEEWDLSIVDNIISDNNKWHNHLKLNKGQCLGNPFILHGECVYGESGWQGKDHCNGVEALMYDIMDLNAEDTFAHMELVFSKDLMLYDNNDEDS